MIKGVALLSYGMGGKLVEWWPSGLRQLVLRLRAIGFDTFDSPYNWYQVNQLDAIIDRVPMGVPIVIGGSSLGDNEANDVARRTKRKIDYQIGFQDSTYGIQIGVPANVVAADNFYNPSWWATFGLGYGKWARAPGNNVTVLRNIPLNQPHPDDWGVAQDIAFSHCHKLMLPPTGAAS
jgi:hypothetical protein